MATDNDNVIDVNGTSQPVHRTEHHTEGHEGEGGKGGKNAKNKKTATYAVLGIFVIILGYLAYKYYENNIAGQGAASTTPTADDSGGASGSGGGAPTPVPAPSEPEPTGGLGPIDITILGNGAPDDVAKVKSAAHKVTGHASGPKITTPKTFEKAAQKVITLASKTSTTPAVKVQKAVATSTNLDITKAIGDQYKDAEAEANAHGHTANPIVHTVSPKVAVPANLDVTKAVAATNVKNAAPKAAPKPAPKAAPKAPVSVGRTRKIA